MTKRALLFAAKFVILTVPLTWLWMEWGRGAYGRFFTYSVGPLYELFNLGLQAGGARERYIGYIPFIALMFITPGISLTRRLLGTAAGFLSIYSFHVIFSLWVQIAYPPGARGTTSGFAIFLPAILLSDSLPFVLWAVLCQDFVRKGASEALGRLQLTGARGRDPASTTASEPADPSGEA
jgi:hypothetical protein